MKNLLYMIIFFIIILFFYLTYFKYISEKNISKIINNRINLEENYLGKIDNLPLLKNDTNNIIEYNSGFNNIESDKPLRSFWDLFKK